ncbi:MAG: DUF5916 domain-containing protein [Vicinamibacterales bacterium]
MKQAFLALFLCSVLTAPALAQPHDNEPQVARAESDPASALPFEIEGPPPPIPPATIARDEQGRVTVRAVRLTAPLRIDGRLDEPFYGATPPLSDFIQNEPVYNVPATEKTEVWVAFDSENVYVSTRAWESQPDRMIVNEMRRDSMQVQQNEAVLFMFDTFYDRRNQVFFQFNPIGGRIDAQITNETTFNGDFNPVWNLKVSRGPDGWTAEAAIPFKSLRYRPGTAQIWGFSARRINRWKNEVSYLTPMPKGYGIRGAQYASLFATLVGLETPQGSRALDVKPYAISDLTSDRTVTPRINNTVGGDIGVDVKYGVTQNLAADFTYRTDFAQVEADEQQVNLTRFSLFFPEKRDFFLENQGLFQFGSNGGNMGGAVNDTPTIFYSRRIGLDRGRAVPITAGGRMSGRMGAFSVGLLNIQTDDEDAYGIPGANFAAARIQRDVMRRSSIGAIFTRRSVLASGPGPSETYGVDGNFAFGDALLRSYWARTSALRHDDQSYRLQLDYNGDRFGVQAERLHVGDNFLPELGFVRRDDLRKNYAYLRYSPRPRALKAVRKFRFEGSLNYIENGAGFLETREQRGEFGIEFQNSDQLEIAYSEGLEAFQAPFAIATNVTIPSGAYGLDTLRAAWTFGQQRRASGTWFFEQGPFYDGRRTAFGYSGARVKFTPRFSVEPGISVNRVRLPFGDFTTKLASSRFTFGFTPSMFVSGLLQFSSSSQSLSSNVRLRWEYAPGSELFVVYSEGRDTRLSGVPELQNRTVVVKINRLLRF